jgi:hypothetical protein
VAGPTSDWGKEILAKFEGWGKTVVELEKLAGIAKGGFYILCVAIPVFLAVEAFIWHTVFDLHGDLKTANGDIKAISGKLDDQIARLGRNVDRFEGQTKALQDTLATANGSINSLSNSVAEIGRLAAAARAATTTAYKTVWWRTTITAKNLKEGDRATELLVPVGLIDPATIRQISVRFVAIPNSFAIDSVMLTAELSENRKDVMITAFGEHEGNSIADYLRKDPNASLRIELELSIPAGAGK